MTNFEKVCTWNKISGNKSMSKPSFPRNEKDFDITVELIVEECSEFVEAYFDKNLENTAKELADILYVVYGAAYRMGINLDKVFNDVHESNMSKFHETLFEANKTVDYYQEMKDTPVEAVQVGDLFVVKRISDGKVVKGINYKEAKVSLDG